MLESKLLLGLLVSVVGGFIVVFPLEWFLRLYIGEKSEYKPRARVPGWFTGIIERGVFTFLIAYEVEDVGTLMAGWLAMKLASNWNRPGSMDERSIAFAFAALLAGLVSMAFAALGGRIAVGAPWWW
jgi:hypothetical protein